MALESDFGRYLASVEERDINLLLMEEFHITPAFVTWFCSQVGIEGADSGEAWHSVSNADGESDLLLRANSGNRRIGVLIENKIGAPDQPQQGERYLLRAEAYRASGKFDAFVIVMCAPQKRLESLPSGAAYQHTVSYEAIAAWFAHQGGVRAEWRRRIMGEAIEQGRRGYTMVVDDTNSAFHREYWEYLQREHPIIHMKPPTPKGKLSTWIVLRGLDFPKGVHLNHKLDKGLMELGFDGRRVGELTAVKADWPDGILPVQRGKTASLMVKVPAIDLRQGFQSQRAALDEALAAARRLLPFASLLSRE